MNLFPYSLLEKGKRFVAVAWGDIVAIGCYVSPNCDLEAFG